MDYIKGQTLAHVWGSLSFWGKLKVAWTLRGYVRQLRTLKAPPGAPPGPISYTDGPLKAENWVLSDPDKLRGPFHSYADLIRFFEGKIRMTLEIYPNLPNNNPVRTTKFDFSEPLVLNHLDINPRNVIVGEDGRLWLIDFGQAGYYPPWFEYISTLRQCLWEYCCRNTYDMTDWKAFIPFICGLYFEQEALHWEISASLMYRR